MEWDSATAKLTKARQLQSPSLANKSSIEDVESNLQEMAVFMTNLKTRLDEVSLKQTEYIHNFSRLLYGVEHGTSCLGMQRRYPK